MMLQPNRRSLGAWTPHSKQGWLTPYERRLMRRLLAPAMTAGAVVGAVVGWWWTRTTDDADRWRGR